MEWLPAAIRDPHGRSLAFTDKGEPKGVLHTTESSSWPGYQGWTVHPHMTVMPTRNVGVVIRQHIPFSRAGFALKNLPGGVQTNTDRAYQIELVGTCSLSGPGYYWPDADEAVLLDLFDKVIRPMTDGLAIPLRALPFRSYPASYGDSPVRLDGPAWDMYSGWCGHQHVAENSHGDPGAFPWSRMMLAVARRAEREDPFMALSDEDANKLADAFVAKLLGLDTIPDYTAREAGTTTGPASTVSLRTVLASVYDASKVTRGAK